MTDDLIPEVHVVLSHHDNNGEGYWQAHIEGIYQSLESADEHLQRLLDEHPPDRDYGCVYDVRFSLAQHKLKP